MPRYSITVTAYDLRPDGKPPEILNLPASRWDLWEIEQRFSSIANADYQFVIDFPAGLPNTNKFLSQMERGERFWSELNFFAHRIAELSHTDLLLLNGAMVIHEPEDVKTLINLTYHLDGIVLDDELSNAEELGHFLLEHEFEVFPEEVEPFLDYGKIGRKHLKECACAFDRNLYYEDTNPVIEEIHDGITLPEAPQIPLLRVGIDNAQFLGGAFMLGLPVGTPELQLIMTLLDCRHESELKVTSMECNARSLYPLLPPVPDFQALGSFAREIKCFQTYLMPCWTICLQSLSRVFRISWCR